MDSLETVTQPKRLNRRLQTMVTDEALTRIRVAAAARGGVSLGQIVSDLAIAHLAPVAVEGSTQKSVA